MRVDVMEINEGNKIIAEFMGWKSNLYSHLPNRLHKDERSIGIDQLQYHASWDWLMPVVEKIKKCGYDDKGFGALKKIDHWLVMVQINELWLACIHFINWYNSNPTRSGQKLKDDE